VRRAPHPTCDSIYPSSAPLKSAPDHDYQAERTQYSAELTAMGAINGRAGLSAADLFAQLAYGGMWCNVTILENRAARKASELSSYDTGYLLPLPGRQGCSGLPALMHGVEQNSKKKAVT